MKEHSYFSNFSDDDVVEFTEDALIKIGKLRKAFKQVFIGEIENFVKIALKSQGIKTFSATEMYQQNGEKIVFLNHWFEAGMACRILRLGNQSWQQGKIKIRVEIEFEPDEMEITQTDINEVIEVELDDEVNLLNSLTNKSVVDIELEILRRQLEGF
jgi:hypothetical protein